MIEIKHRYTGKVLFAHNGESLSGANLRGANLSGADLSYVDLHGADLRGVDLSYANLSYANLSDADLSGADLRGADLSVANLSSANLRGAALPPTFRTAALCFGGWQVTITPTHTTIGCQHHANKKWLAWTPKQVAYMADNAQAWWADHGAAVKAVIRNVQKKPSK